MNPHDTQDLIEQALERAIDVIDLVATDVNLDRELRRTQELCNQALVELRGFGYQVHKEEWQRHDQE